MTVVCNSLSDYGSFQNPLDGNLPILSLIETSHAPNKSKYLDPVVTSPPLLMVPKQKNWKCALIMIWSMHIYNVAAKFRLASGEFMQNDTIYNPLSRDKMVLHAPSDLSITFLSSFSPLHFSPLYFNSLH